MAEYINREELERLMCEQVDGVRLDDVPSIELVRCEYCRHCSVDFIGDYVCNAHRMEVIEENDYCSYGKERKE